MNRGKRAGLALCGALLAACVSRTAATGGAGRATYGGSTAALTTPNLTRDWPSRSRDVAAAIEMKYGAPAEVTASMLIWSQTGPFKRTIAYNYELPHAFPVPHSDVLEQTIDFRVPVDKVDDIILFDGSLVVNRTAGELSARCGQEEMNFLALNLAHDIIVERRTVAEARREYARLAAAFSEGRTHPYTEGLQFRIPAVDARDPDRPIQGGP